MWSFSANVNGTALNFRISGLLYNSDVLLYARQSASLWSQLTAWPIAWDAASHSARALDDTGEELPTVQGFWCAWYAFHPDTEIFAPE